MRGIALILTLALLGGSLLLWGCGSSQEFRTWTNPGQNSAEGYAPLAGTGPAPPGISDDTGGASNPATPSLPGTPSVPPGGVSGPPTPPSF